MPITGAIPLPETGMEAFIKSLKEANENKLRQAQAAYQQQEANRSQQITPYDIEYKKAQTQEAQSNASPELLRAKIEEMKARGNYYNQNRGGAGLAAGGKDESFFQSLIAKDNPEFANDPAKVYQASNLVRQGIFQFPDGTTINKLSPASQTAWDHVVRGSTYAGAAVPLIKANQAEAEIKVMSDMAQKDFAPYATTYAGYSPQQIGDTFKSDDESQIKLGNFAASQAAQYELAQLRNRIAGGEPGIQATHELVKNSRQVIKTLFPRMSAKARQQAEKRLNEYFESGLNARKSAGIGVTSVLPNTQQPTAAEGSTNTPKRLKYNIETGAFE